MQIGKTLMEYNPGVLDGSDCENIRIGNSHFHDDIWDFTGLETTNGGASRLLLKFNHIKKKDIRTVVKQFMAACLLKQKLSGVKRVLVAVNRFNTFLEDNFPNVVSLEELSPMILKTYYHHLLTTTSSTRHGPLSRSGLFHCGRAIKEILLEGNVRKWKVPKECSWVLPLYTEMIEESPRTRMSEQKTKKLYSDEVIQKIIRSAFEESCPITRAAIIIQSQIGLRLSEILTLRSDCIKKDAHGNYKIECWISKTKKGIVSRLKPANDLVAEVVEKLAGHTASLRMESGLDYLFIKRDPSGRIIRCQDNNWNRDYMEPFVQRGDIRENGELIHLSSHYFRHIFATYAHRKGMPIQSIMKMFDHESLVMTGVYTHITQEDTRAKFAEVFSEGSIIAGIMADKIQERLKNDNPFQGRAEREIIAIMNAMRIHVTASGICFHHPVRRDICADDGDCLVCPNFVTTEAFLPVHRKRVEKLETEMARAKEQGNDLWFAKNKEIRDRIVSQFINPIENKLKNVAHSGRC